ncbi:hypothetical protein V8E53_006208 [Lactarius tabidus]
MNRWGPGCGLRMMMTTALFTIYQSHAYHLVTCPINTNVVCDALTGYRHKTKSGVPSGIPVPMMAVQNNMKDVAFCISLFGDRS